MIKVVNFTVTQLIKNYCHIGHAGKLLNKNSVNYLLGNYSGVSVIDINKSLIFLKYSFNILQYVFLSNGYIAFVLNNKNIRLTRFKRLRKARIIYNCKWKGGTISNYKSFRKTGVVTRGRFPNAIIVDLMKDNEFFGETLKKFPIFIIFFIDTIHNIFKFDSFVLINNKSTLSLLYFHFLFINFIIRLTVLKKIKFFELVKKKLLDIFNKQTKVIRW